MSSEAVAEGEIDSRSARETLLDAAPVCLVAGAAVVGLASAQGGYFPTSWGWASTALLWVVGVWAVASGRTDAGRLDLAFAGLLGLFTAWVAASTAWSVAPSLTVLELQRVLVYLAGVGAVLLVTRRRDLGWLVAALVAAIAGVAVYALATRLFPDHFEGFDPIAVYRLSEPVGYWNGLGILCVLGLVLAVGAVADASSVAARGLAAAAVVPCSVALYFTYSRGAWLALAAGVVVAVALTPYRLRFAVASLAAGVPAGLAVLVASRSEALTNRTADLERAVNDGRRLALVVVALSVAAGLAAWLFHAAERRVTLPRGAHIGATVAIVALLGVGVVAAIAEYGSPVSMAERAWNAFEAAPERDVDDLNDRLLSFSGNGRVELWTAARDLYEEHPAVGSGAGTFERFWRERPDATQRVRDAHGLYIETLAELGPLGLGLLVAALLVPLLAAVIARRTLFVAGAAGAYGAFLVHAGVDWDWELSGVTLAALVTGCVLVVAARDGVSRLLSTPLRIVVGVVVGLASLAAILGGLGNSALARSFSATEKREFADALHDADRARQLMPWSGRPWIARGEAELAQGDRAAAAASFRRSTEEDANDWRAWLDLAIATEGPTRRAALARARVLYPRSTEIERVATELAAK
jgi:hypothetical protein